MTNGSLSVRHLVIVLVLPLVALAPGHAEGGPGAIHSGLGVLLDADCANESLLTAKSGMVLKGDVADYEKQSLRGGEAASHREDRARTGSLMIKLGAYLPDNDIEDMDTGFFGQFTYNRYLTRYFAFEVGGGTFFASTEMVFELDADDSDEQRAIGGDLYAFNLIINLKMVLPFPSGEIYAGIGPGVYFLFGDLDDRVFNWGDNDIVFGGQAVAGINFDISRSMFLGLEGQYIVTGDATFTTRRFFSTREYSNTFNVNGYSISGVIGFKF